MEQYITNLILTDVKLAIHAHLSREFLDVHSESLGTNNILSILHFMGITPAGETLDRYFDLVNTVRTMKDKEEMQALPKVIYDFLLTCDKREAG